MFKSFTHYLARIEAFLVASVMLTISALVFAQVLTRYVFQYSTPWLEELTRFLMIWMVMIASAYAVRTRQHIAVDVLETVITSPRWATVYRMCLSVICLGFCLTLTYLSYVVVHRTVSFGQLSGAMRIPMYLANGSFLLAGILMSIHYLDEIVRLAIQPKSRDVHAKGVLK